MRSLIVHSRRGEILLTLGPLALHSFFSLRVYPHDQDTGGFFVAVIQKAGEPQPEPRAAANAAQETLEQTATSLAAKPVEAQPPTDTMSHQATVEPTANTVSDDDERPAKRAKVDQPDEKAKPAVPKKEKEPKAIGLPLKEEPFNYLAPDNPEVQACL